MRTKQLLPALGVILSLPAVLGLQAVAQDAGSQNHHNHIQHVLLVSIDGMHAVDYLNCSQGITGVNGGKPYCPSLAALGLTAINYLDTSTSRPSDSFPGLMTLMSGATPRLHGAFYDDAYDRVLAPPTITTGDGLDGGPCTPNQANGTSTEYDEGIDINQTYLNGIDGISTKNGDGGIKSIDPKRLVRDPFNNCTPVYPWNFVRTNTIYGVIHQGGGYTAWSDKHPSYSSVAGPGDGSNLDDYYSPEINSTVVALPGITTVLGAACNPIRDSSNLSAWTDSFENIQCYDQLKVNAILNEIDGYNHNHTQKTQVPTIFGMNFQAVSVGQKLIEANVGSGGYLDDAGTPSSELLGEIRFVDAAIGSWVEELQKQGLTDSTVVIITAKHGQSPIDSQRYTGITTTGPVTTSPSMLIDSCLPASESNAGGQLGPTEDDVSLLWLLNSASCTTSSQVQILETQSPATSNIAGIGEIFWGQSINQLFNPPGLPPNDPRTPDILVTPNIGVTYSTSTKKLAEHGGFSHDDTNVMILVSNPSYAPATITIPVLTAQVAPTILQVLGYNPQTLQSVQQQGTQVLPGIPQGH
jgi:hypothetical protein